MNFRPFEIEIAMIFLLIFVIGIKCGTNYVNEANEGNTESGCDGNEINFDKKICVGWFFKIKILRRKSFKFSKLF